MGRNLNDFNINIDEELNGIFREQFAEKGKQTDTAPSTLYKKLTDMKAYSFAKNLSDSTEARSDKQKKQFTAKSRNAVYKHKIEYYRADLFGEYSEIKIQGRHFTIPNAADTRTVAYRIEKYIDYGTRSFTHNAQSLQYAEKYTENYELEQTFFVDEPNAEEELLLLSFDTVSYDVYVNFGILSLKDDMLWISKRPKLIHLTKPAPSANLIRSYSTHEYADKSLSGDTGRFTERWFNADLSGHIIIVDPETCETVKREVYYDTEQNEWKARIKLKLPKSYFALDICMTQEDGKREFSRPLTLLEQGKNFRFGTYHFPVDYMEAFRYLEQDGSPEADYHIAGIFFADSEFYDENTGVEYLKKSAAGNWHAAQVDLAVWYYFNAPQDHQKAADLIKAAVEAGYAPAQFVAGYAYENGIVVDKDIQSAFDLYLAAAKDDYAPAILRLSQEYQETHGEDNARASFLASADKADFYAKYCLGKALLGKIHMEEWSNGLSCLEDRWLGINSARGFDLILLAAGHRCANAIFDAAYIFDFGEIGIRQDKSQALKWYRKIAESSDAIAFRISTCLLDGIGCEQNEDADEEAYDLLFSFIKNGQGPQMVMHKLGWMHFFGRGCAVNYELAKMFFETAGRGPSYYYLGKIYEDGLVGDADMILAVECYKKGAELESKECIQRLNELNASEVKNKAPSLSTEEKIDLIYGTVTETNVCTKLIADNLSRTLTFIENDLSGTLREAKRKLRDSTAVMELDRLPDDEISAFIEKLSEYINQNTGFSEVLFAEETKHLSSLFGQAWDSLLPTSKTSLISAGILWKSCAKIGDDKEFDFSGICISATSALENELKRYFYIGFQEYLKKTYGSPSDEKWEETFKNWPEIVLSTTKYEYEQALENPVKFKKPILNIGTNFTLGSMPFLLGAWRGKNISNDQFSLLLDRMDEYLQTIVKDNYQQNARLAFVDNSRNDSLVNKCEKIRREYRNKAAHIDIVTKRQAENCYRAVIGKIDAYDYNTNVTSALLELFSILK